MDLEWNGSWSKAAHGYFNEIIEIGATMLDDSMQKIGGFHAMIRPVVSKKITNLVTDLTGIAADELKDGISFEQAMRDLTAWIGEGPSVLLTWSNTDLSVLLENYRFFFKKTHLPWMQNYVDAQAYCQSRMDGDDKQQMGLTRACETLGISDEGLTAHRAQDDSEMTARVLAKLFDRESFEAALRPADEEFYKRLTFKPYVIGDIHHPLIKNGYLSFRCTDCHRRLKTKKDWRFFNQSFFADMVCPGCGKAYTARVQVKKKYEGVAVKRKLTEKAPKPAEPEIITKGENRNG